MLLKAPSLFDSSLFVPQLVGLGTLPWYPAMYSFANAPHSNHYSFHKPLPLSPIVTLCHCSYQFVGCFYAQHFSSSLNYLLLRCISSKMVMQTSPPPRFLSFSRFSAHKYASPVGRMRAIDHSVFPLAIILFLMASQLSCTACSFI